MPDSQSSLDVDQLVNALATLFKSSRRKDAMQFCRDLYQCSQFLRGYHHPANPKGETTSAANLLDLSRNCIYSKMRDLQLTPDDFRQSRTLDELVAKSRVMKQKAALFESAQQAISGGIRGKNVYDADVTKLIETLIDDCERDGDLAALIGGFIGQFGTAHILPPTG